MYWCPFLFERLWIRSSFSNTWLGLFSCYRFPVDYYIDLWGFSCVAAVQPCKARLTNLRKVCSNRPKPCFAYNQLVGIFEMADAADTVETKMSQLIVARDEDEVLSVPVASRKVCKIRKYMLWVFACVLAYRGYRFQPIEDT